MLARIAVAAVGVVVVLFIIGALASDPAPPATAEEPASAEAERETAVSGITFREVNDAFGIESRMTDLQKDRLWESDYDGRCVEWTGELTSLDEGLFSGYVAQFRHLSTTFVSDVVMQAPNSAEDELLTWSIGSHYTYRARLESYGVLLGISVSMGCD